MQKPPLIETVRERQLRLGHVLRQDPSLICQRYALYWPQQGKRKRDRPKLLFHKYVAQITGLDSQQAITRAGQDRDSWRELVVGCCKHAQPP